ncbi:MAG TPA: DUF4331 domain-containing protein [Thermoanaerobaculia bacterium]|nr:DUF4331 domain-containing protein [Thermoanaerobaculia bacterium]
MHRSPRLPLLVALTLVAGSALFGSSHREAPAITESPKVDGTDFYMFRSYEPGREGFVTLLANYVPLQDPFGGPNYYALDPDAAYQIHIDNSGDGIEDLTFRFQTLQVNSDAQIPVGDQMVSIPLHYSAPNTLNTVELYAVSVLRGDAFGGNADVQAVTNAGDGGNIFVKPFDNVGNKTIPSYETYARQFVYDVSIPGCGDGRMFVGQRKESFYVNLGEMFDLVNLEPLGPVDGQGSALTDKNITTFALEVPIDCLTGSSGVIGGWTTAVLPRRQFLVDQPSFNQPTELDPTNDFVQVSRLGAPLVNEMVIGLKDKDRFNNSRPANDVANFGIYVTNPTLPELLEILFPVQAPNNFPRQDLVAAFITGIDGLNQFGVGEMLRFNTEIPSTPLSEQSNLGVAGGDMAGFPNGRRPGDDVVDVVLRVAMGLLCHAFPGAFGCGPADAPSGNLPFTDGAFVDATFFDGSFPYLRTPLPGSPNEEQNGVDPDGNGD